VMPTDSDDDPTPDTPDSPDATDMPDMSDEGDQPDEAVFPAACEQAGFEPHISAFPDPPLPAMLARLPAGREVRFATACSP
jgi:hypothetical protein